MHTTTSSACPACRSAARAAVFATNWTSPRYLALHGLKDRLHSAWMRAECHSEIERLNRRYRRVVQAVSAFEDRALLAAGLRP